jgi:hypothetical protein
MKYGVFLNNILKFSSYLAEHTLLVRYKNRLDNIVEGNNRGLLRESYEARRLCKKNPECFL